jgi:hypothetical protein
MNRPVLITFVASALLVISFVYAEWRFGEIKSDLVNLSDTLAEIRDENSALREQLATLDREQAALAIEMVEACDTLFPTGVYRLVTETSYGPGDSGEYEIYHASAGIKEWRVNVGARLNDFAVPTDIYLDYNGDGRIDTSLAARFVREIPVFGNTLADRLIAGSVVQQNLYTVFSCEWRDAEFFAAHEMDDSANEAAQYLWDLVQSQSESLGQWIESL